MKRLSLAVVIALAFALALPGATGLGPVAAIAKTKAKPKDPESVIRAIYAQYSKDAGPAEAQQQYFSADLYQLWIDVQRGANGVDDVGVNFDVFLDAADLDAVTDVATKFTPNGGDRGTVDVTFTASGKATAVSYPMIKTARGWKIDNIVWGGKRGDLRATLAAIKKKQGT